MVEASRVEKLDPLLPGSVVLGLALGYLTRGRLSRLVDRVLMPNVVILVAVMGLSAGVRIRGEGASSLVYGSLAVALIPSLVSLGLALLLVGGGRPQGRGDRVRVAGPWPALAGLLAGSIVGYYTGLEAPGEVVSLLLYLLLLLSGYSIGGSEGLWEGLARGGVRGLLLALSCLVGGALGGALVGVLLGWGAMVGAAMGVASGWYSLVGPLLYIVDPIYGAAAFLGNLMRESLHIILYPLLSRRIPLAAVAVGGATTMDTGLPVVAAYGGPEERVAAFVQGAVLTLLLSVGLPVYVSLLQA